MQTTRETTLVCAWGGGAPRPVVPKGISVHSVELDWHQIGRCFWRTTLPLPLSLHIPGGTLIPCLSAARVPYQFVLHVDNRSSAAHLSSEWVGAFAPITGAFFPRLYTTTTIPSSGKGHAPATVDVDMARVELRPDRMGMEVTVYDSSQRWLEVPYVFTISHSAVVHTRHGEDSLGASAQFETELPCISQYELSHELCGKMCSPTSVSMVLRSYGVDTDVEKVAHYAEVPESAARYGVWPANVWAAAQYGCRGYVLQFPDWQSAASLLERGVPIVASIRYQKGALTNAPAEETPYGHVVVLAGYTRDGQVVVYDPAARCAETVRRLYDWRQFCDAWFNHHGVGYIIMPPS